jgi:DNA mismatch repair protein MutL
MGIIQVMDEQLANRIAAGEVVERPASVVKELAENAIDAGATEIDIAVEEGGLASIRVRDNGSGIEADDLERAFLRHATSKIRTDRDLFRIATLGFRGEALPSIAAVSRVTCASSADGSGLGRKIVLEGGAVKSIEQAAAQKGTDIAVRDLFYNTPARLKYMKTIQTELGHISDCVNRLALSHPGIAFSLTHNGNTLLRTTGGGDRLQVIAAVYGAAAARQMLRATADHPDYTLDGWLSKPELTRANRSGITTIVNGRYIRSFAIQQAILEAYHTLLPVGRFPLVVLEVGMHPGLLDVNVHPSKQEVRFSKEAELKELVESALRRALGRTAHIPSAPSAGMKPAVIQERLSFPPAAPSRTEAKPASAGSSYVPRDAAERLYRPSAKLDEAAFREAAAGLAYGAERSSADPGAAIGAVRPAAAPGAAADPASPAAKSGPASAPADAASANTAQAVNAQAHAAPEPAAQANAAQAERGAGSAAADQSAGSPNALRPDGGRKAPEGRPFPELSWIGQLHGTYILAQSEDGLYLIDQHAAHERINYEYYLRKFADPPKLSQTLLVPITLEFTPGEAEAIRGRLDAFAAAGVELEPFGGSAFLVRAYPEWLPQGSEKAIIEEMAEWILAEKKAIDIGKLREKAAIMTACKASIKANDRMTREEGEALIARLAACSQPYTCPHGRPIVVHISTYQLEKMFKRVM